MSKLYEYQSNYHRTTETLRVRKCGQGVYLGVYSISKMPLGMEDAEQTTSIVLPLNEIDTLIQALATANADNHLSLLAFNSVQIKALITALEFTMDFSDDIGSEAMPYDLIQILKTKLDRLLQVKQHKGI